MTWQERAACLGTYKSVDFFPTDWMRGKWDDSPERVAREAKAKAFCAQCPVTHECLTHALEQPERFGVWGGMNTRERDEVRRRRLRRAS